MWLALECLLLCGVFFLLCYLGTGSDEKNIKSYSSYPTAVQNIVKEQPKFKSKMKVTPVALTFVSNVIMFSVILFVFGIFVRKEGFLPNFLNVLILGEVLNAFDFLVMDLLWWRHSPRIRFEGTENQKELYLSPTKHFYAFLRGIFAFLAVALIDGFFLSLLPV